MATVVNEQMEVSVAIAIAFLRSVGADIVNSLLWISPRSVYREIDLGMSTFCKYTSNDQRGATSR